MARMLAVLFVLFALMVVCGGLGIDAPDHCLAVMEESDAQVMFVLDKWQECHEYWLYVGYDWRP